MGKKSVALCHYVTHGGGTFQKEALARHEQALAKSDSYCILDTSGIGEQPCMTTPSTHVESLGMFSSMQLELGTQQSNVCPQNIFVVWQTRPEQVEFPSCVYVLEQSRK